MRSLLVAVLLTLPLLGCTKKVETKVSGTADEQMEQYGAELEELRSKAQAAEWMGPDICGQAGRVCEISSEMCSLATSAPDRDDFQQRCGSSQESCAQFNDSCAKQ